jgi:hypothetical protein
MPHQARKPLAFRISYVLPGVTSCKCTVILGLCPVFLSVHLRVVDPWPQPYTIPSSWAQLPYFQQRCELRRLPSCTISCSWAPGRLRRLPSCTISCIQQRCGLRRLPSCITPCSWAPGTLRRLPSYAVSCSWKPGGFRRISSIFLCFWQHARRRQLFCCTIPWS